MTTSQTLQTWGELRTAVEHLQRRLLHINEIVHPDRRRANIVQLQEQMMADGFWDDAQRAGQIAQRLESLKKQERQHEQMETEIAQLRTLVDDDDEGDDDTLALYVQEYNTLRTALDALETQLLLSEPYDDHDALLTIFAGAGGADAQDWAEMLLRMYTRFADRHGWAVRKLDASPGAEGGYKSVTIEVRGEYAYGMLRTEHGTHRLVRLSPFNADNLRQTSFARVEVLPVLEDDTDTTIAPSDIRIDTYRSQGAGGQSVNTTDSAVRITHIPTGIVVTCQNERSQLQNKEQAMRILRGRLLQRRLEEQAETRRALRGTQTTAAWGTQIRSYVLHPYKRVKDHRTGYETVNIQDVLDGDLDAAIAAALHFHARNNHAILETDTDTSDKT